MSVYRLTFMATMQCAVCLSSAGWLAACSVPLQLAALASLPAVGNINNPCISSSFPAAVGFCCAIYTCERSRCEGTFNIKLQKRSFFMLLTS